jgi:hypothetical protein
MELRILAVLEETDFNILLVELLLITLAAAAVICNKVLLRVLAD